MKPLINPIPAELIEKELTSDKFVRPTNFGNNCIYIFNYHTAPNTTLEVGRLRELAFRKAGGGTGKSYDLDKYDLQNVPYSQLIVWSPEEKVILGGYRFLKCSDAPVAENGDIQLATYKLFKFSQKFIKDYFPYTIELGRSFVHPNFQTGQSDRKSIFALDNLWDGLGAITVDHPEIRYFFGKVTMYTHYNQEARNLLMYFLQKHFPSKDELLTLIDPLPLNIDHKKYEKIFIYDDYTEDRKILNAEIRKLGENIPPLINAYMNLSPSMQIFGTSINHDFGGVEETAIMIDLHDIYKSKSDRHIKSYLEYKQSILSKKISE